MTLRVPMPTPAKPNKIARDIPVDTAKLFRTQKHPDMFFYQNDCLDWNGASYRMIENKTIESELLKFLEKCVCSTEYGKTDEAGVPVLDENGKQITGFRNTPFNPKDADVNQVFKPLNAGIT
jgi:hypothetical protein